MSLKKQESEESVLSVISISSLDSIPMIEKNIDHKKPKRRVRERDDQKLSKSPNTEDLIKILKSFHPIKNEKKNKNNRNDYGYYIIIDSE